MLETLPKLPKKAIIDFNDIKKSMKKLLDVNESDDSIILFLLPVNIKNNKVKIDPHGMFMDSATYESSNQLFSKDNSIFFKTLKMYLKTVGDDNYKDFILCHGSINGGIVIDGYIKDYFKLSNNGATIADAYFTLKKDQIYYSEKAIELDISDLIKEVINLGYFNKEEHIDGLKKFVEHLIYFGKKGLHKEHPAKVSKIIQDAFYKELDVRDIEEEKDNDLFITFAEGLNFSGILNATATIPETGEVFDYFKASSFEIDKKLENLEEKIIIFTISFNERFLKVYYSENENKYL